MYTMYLASLSNSLSSDACVVKASLNALILSPSLGLSAKLRPLDIIFEIESLFRTGNTYEVINMDGIVCIAVIQLS